jgi:hypothetical protein
MSTAVSDHTGTAGLAYVDAPADHREGMREGVSLGLLVAAITWVWIAVVDAIAGQPFHTFTILGGVATFTVLHCLLNIGYASAIVAAVRGAARTPSLIIGVIFVFLIMEVGFAMMTALISTIGASNAIWLGIFGGSLISALTLFGILSRRYPLLDRLHAAEDER